MRRDYPDRLDVACAHETIYQALYVQAKGGLRREVASWLRTGRVQHRPQRRPDQRRQRMATRWSGSANVPPRWKIAPGQDAVPGHWEGDLIIGKNHGLAIGTLVERATRFVMLLHLPDGYSPAAVRAALVAKIQTLP